MATGGASCPVSSYLAGKAVTKGKGLSAAGLATLAQLAKGNNDTSEDCLTLNVWTRPQTRDEKKAVVIWVHGKGYTTGSSSDPVYDGQFIVNEQDIILVTFNFAYVDDPIISGIALLSGTTSLSGWDPDSLPKADRDWNSLSPACATKPPPRSLPPFQSPLTRSKAFFPNNDGKTVFSDYYELARTGKFIKVPLLIGNTDDETAYHRTMADVFAPSYGYGQTNYDNERRNYYICPASERVRHTTDLGVPTWRYGYFGDFKDARLTTAAHGRAYHDSDDADELKLANYARGALAAFARNPKTGLKTYRWPQYNPKTKSLVQLGKDNKVGTFTVTPAAFDTGCLY
ncbi:hypothetical protein GMDG_00547 [Pseudogymnoascus destructans 20631-21]|uniref:Carboxylesterase type B domain-containing protein n=1 Tax=Pseudogymnoascus destructans (strain ATCC MYA-4855 / 20631-21) TaxID=658429 RepID=L8G747_PSED2|nr:hypothetical protein GMDG_00547 [Pseudogymnoascus destructans 20631-21]